ncbi:FtsK/SpoIIIE domain-containing protein [Sutcliffiella cohnii]
MALEFLLIPAAIGAVGLFGNKLNRKLSDKKKIEKIFFSLRLGVKEKDKKEPSFPTFDKQEPILNGEEEVGIKYVYVAPLGFPIAQVGKLEAESIVFSNGLNRPVELSVKGREIILDVYHKQIPKKIFYREVAESSSAWHVPMGMHFKGILWHDFSLNPHMIIGGATGYGKTVIMKSIMTYLIENNPDDIKMFIIDLKGGLEFKKYEKLEQVIKVAGTPEEAWQILNLVEQLLLGRFALFAKNGWTNINDCPLQERLFIFVDEAAQLIPQNKGDKLKVESQDQLERVAALGRAVGVHLVFGTQYPTSDALPKFVKQNSDTRVGFRLADSYASEVVLGKGNTQCSKLPYKHPGRCIYKADDTFELQVPYITDTEMWERLSKWEVQEEEVKQDVVSEEGEDTVIFR